MNKNFFAHNLYFLRKSAGLKQHDMQEKLGIRRNTWSNWENGKAEPDITTICRIANFFKLDAGKLVTTDISAGPKHENMLEEPELQYPSVPCIACDLKDSIITSQKQTIKALLAQAEALKESLDIIKRRKIK